MNPKYIKYPDYDLDADKAAKEKMMGEMLYDLKNLNCELSLSVAIHICHVLLKQGWRKVSHDK